MIDIRFIMSFIAAIVGYAIGTTVYSAVSTALPCPGYNSTTKTYDTSVQGYQQCTNGFNYGWIVIGIFPISFFFAVFYMFGAVGGGRD